MWWHTRKKKTDFVFRRNRRVHVKRRGRQFSRLLAAEVCAPAVVMVDTPCSEVVWRVLATHSIRQFPLHFPTRMSPSGITFQLDTTTVFPFCSNSRSCYSFYLSSSVYGILCRLFALSHMVVCFSSSYILVLNYRNHFPPCLHRTAVWNFALRFY
jgi:hypothetical protein